MRSIWTRPSSGRKLLANTMLRSSFQLHSCISILSPSILLERNTNIISTISFRIGQNPQTLLVTVHVFSP